MKHFTTPDFWYRYRNLPAELRELADKNFALMRQNPHHPSLRLKKIGSFWSARVGLHYRGLGPDVYAAKAKTVTIRHVSNHRVVAMVEMVSPGNKNTQNGLNAFIRKARETLAAGIHLLLIDLFPPSARDPQGIHGAVWGEDCSAEYALPADKPFTCVSYVGGPAAEAFIELVGIGDTLPVMPLFLTPDVYVSVPLETTYQLVWDGMPAYWREVLISEPESRGR